MHRAEVSTRTAQSTPLKPTSSPLNVYMSLFE